MYVTLAANESTRDYLGLHALPFLSSVNLKVESGSIGGSITCWVDHLCEEYYDKRGLILDAEVIAVRAALGGIPS